MAEQINYNLDDVQEYFTFTIKGHTYHFRHMNTEEMEEMSKIKEDKAQQAYLFKFITPEDEKAPSIQDITKSFTIPNWRAFTNMVETEFSLDKAKPTLDAAKK